jgi:hypothetical protein
MSVSSFFWSNSLVSAVENGHGTNSQLSHISQLGLKSMLYKRLNIYGKDDIRWQNIAKALAKTDSDVSFDLANYYINKNDESVETMRNIELWLLQAVRLGHLDAKVSLARIYVGNNQLLAAKKLLVPIKSDLSALMLLIEISLLKGKLKDIEYYSSLLYTMNTVNQKDEGKIFYEKLVKYGVIHIPIFETETETETDCLATIAPFAVNLDNLEYFDKLISSSNLSLLNPYLCFLPVKYVSKIELDCQHNKNEAIQCDESIWQNKNGLNNNRFVAVLVDEGGANVNSGILYIDRHDTEEVFFHELTHFLGFIDEYPLAKNHFRCSSVQQAMFSHNIAILPRLYQGSRKVVRQQILNQLPWAKYISSQTRLISKTREGWMLGTLDEEVGTVGAFIAESCNEKEFVAIRALKQRTSLRYFEEEFPDLYLQMLMDNPDKFLMPHFTHNVLEAIK